MAVIRSKYEKVTSVIAKHKNVRLLLSLLKQYEIRNVVISPGSRNIPVTKSLLDDNFFTCYSIADERSAAYFAVGISLETNTPVAIVSTSGQATRNYLPGLTEAFYRKSPILAIVCDYDASLTDQGVMQSIQQTDVPADSANVVVDIPIIKDDKDVLLATRRLNDAMSALRWHGGGPAWINVRIDQLWGQGGEVLERARRITRYTPFDKDWPTLDNKKVLVVVGEHLPMSPPETSIFERFVCSYNAVVYVSHISNYRGVGATYGNRALSFGGLGQLRPDVLITMGGLLGDYPLNNNLKGAGIEHWRICQEGKLADTYGSLTKVFECPEPYFFDRMLSMRLPELCTSYVSQWSDRVNKFATPINLPLSNPLVAQRLSQILPKDSILHLGILNSLRSWELVDVPSSVRCYSNVAGFGIDGSMSTFLGHSITTDKLSFLVIGDLSFFYDMNSLGIRHIKNNVRIVLINNDGGSEFCSYTHPAHKLDNVSNTYISASGHYGSSVSGWAENNGFTYMRVDEEKDLDTLLVNLVKPSNRPILMEVMTTKDNDARAFDMIRKANQR
jgi:2-succinyl-5-enolpyruvyl-6-hydroxy-3-cyclohexene-1-carboxylate synthase